MLKFMRTHATSWFIKILLTLIIVVFVLWGMGSIKDKKETIVATVGDNYVTRVEFDRAYHNFRKNLEGQLSPELLKGLNIKQQVLDQLIDATVEQQWAQNIGLRVSDDELMQTILQNPAFQRDGQFDGNLYEQFLRSIGLDTVTFPTLLKRELMNQRVGNLVGNAAVILTEEEVKELYFLENGKINLSFVEVSPQAFAKQVTVTEGDLERYYAEHKEEFRAPAQVKVLYLRFSPDAYRKEAEVSSQEVQEYYAMNREQYQRPERVRIRDILIRVSPDASPDVVEKARLKAQKIVTEARQDARGANFAALARQYSDDASASKGGDLGYFSRGEIDPVLGKMVFDLRKGEIGPVVRTSHGFHIAKVEDVQEGTRRTLDEVRKEIVSRLMNEKAKDRAAMHAEDAAYQARNKTGGLKPYADGARLKVREAGPFRAGEPEAKEKLPSVAFTLGKGDISSPFRDGEDYLVLQVVDKIPPQAPPLERVRGRMQEAFVSSLARGLAQGAARDLLIAWEKGPGFGDLLRRYGLKVAETGFFKRSSAAPPRIGPLGAYVGKIATLTLEDPWLDDVAEVNGAFVVVKLTGVEMMDEKKYEAEKDAFRKQLNYYKGMELLQGWLLAMKKNVAIEINQDILGEYR